jgi:hypothetical protein
VVKTLFATKRERPDTSTSVAFFSTRVRAPDQDDRRKLAHLMKYLIETRRLPLVLSADGSGILKWWVDASFAVHPNMCGHSGGGLSSIPRVPQRPNLSVQTIECPLFARQDFCTLLRRSTRSTTQPSSYIPSTTGSKYSCAVTQLENNGVLHPDAHMFLQEGLYQAEPDVVTAVMTQLSLKNGLKEWGDQAYETAVAEMKQLHFRNTVEPLHWRHLCSKNAIVSFRLRPPHLP